MWQLAFEVGVAAAVGGGVAVAVGVERHRTFAGGALTFLGQLPIILESEMRTTEYSGHTELEPADEVFHQPGHAFGRRGKVDDSP